MNLAPEAAAEHRVPFWMRSSGAGDPAWTKHSMNVQCANVTYCVVSYDQGLNTDHAFVIQGSSGESDCLKPYDQDFGTNTPTIYMKVKWWSDAAFKTAYDGTA